MTTIVVTAAVIRQGEQYLVTRRQGGVHLAGYWEFPGGKCADPESLRDCMKREIFEELDVEADVGREILATTHAYDDRRVELHFFECRISGQPTPQQGQQMRWVSTTELGQLPFPPADAELIRILTGSP
jgi:mutator protein MutT